MNLLAIRISDDGDRSIVRHVIPPKKIPDVFQPCSLYIRVRADNVRVVGMLWWKELVIQTLVADPIRSVLVALAPLIANPILLVSRFGLVQLVQQVPHAVRFQPKRQIELVRRYGLVVVGPVE